MHPPATPSAALLSRARRSALSLGLLAAAGLCALPAAARDASPTPDQLRWLERVQFGLDSASVAALGQQGQRDYLRAQLHPDAGDTNLPTAVQAQLQSYEGLNVSAPAALTQLAARQKEINAMPDGDAKAAAKKALQEQKNQNVQQVRQAELLRAVYDPDQLREQLVWFWLNHFSVQADKARVGWVLGDYVDRAIRPNALGHFSDLVLATLKSPAMLDYLDNAQNAKGKVNENYARELMELHTLGVDAGYTQHDVQQLALVLTGVGIAPPDRDGPPKLKPAQQAQYLREGAFEFNPARHQEGDKTLLGQRIAGGGFDEVRSAVELITRQPACAHFISSQLAQYFVADTPPPALVDKMAKAFLRSDGDIAKVMEVMVSSREFADAGQRKFKDPYRYLVSSIRFAYDGQVIANPAPLVGWLGQLGEQSFGRITPDGWPLASDAWNSSGQMAKRFEIARAIGGGDARLFTPAKADGKAEQQGGFPMPASRLFYAAIEPTLAPATREALAKARSQQEWNAFLLASPDFNYR
ncbi:DUF1800 domain-containing protein [Pseudoxanthomonas winnipegensis]|uniref:DUF1800 domain-containing protein n=1 Tax=Pseudoxanthomonas winnipegensis TaxID=2480810 RepID=A0A4Q8M3G0_9GAMM|nr:DUF1800 domain-containing protein [Pseudoxanthomonas winnipegensis]TAA40141.1 DUF1800 domain-containing protein [Pseudoxanthomonas winnipegensis]